MVNPIKILHLEDLPADVKLIWRVLKKANPEYEGLVVETRERFTEALKTWSPDIILSDHSLPSFNSHEALEILHGTGMKIPFILITSKMSEDFAVDVIKRGADDYILKDRLERLPTAIHNILEKFSLERERRFFLEEVIKNEKRYRSLIENINDAILLINERTEILYQSPSVERIVGFTAADSKGTAFLGYVHPDDRRDYSTIYEWAIAQPAIPIPARYRVLHKDGSYVWTEGTITNLLQDASVKALIINYRDVTKERQAEDKIVHANRLYAFLSQINKTIVHVTDEQTLFDEACKIAVMEGKFKMAWLGIPDPADKKIRLVASCGASSGDRELLADYSYRCDGPIDKTLQNGRYHVINDIQHESWAGFGNYITDSGFNSGICLAIRKSGRPFGILTIYSTEVNFFDSEEIALLVEATTDISFALDVFEKDAFRTRAEERLKHNELQLVQAELRYRQIVETAQEGIWLLDENDTTTFVNKKLCDILEYPEEEMLGKQNFFFMDDEGREDAAASMRRRRDGIAEKVDLRYITKSGKHIWASVAANPVFNADRKYVGALAMLSDITERKVSETRLRELNVNLQVNSKKLAMSNAELERFAYVASHDLQEPLRMVTGFLTQIQAKYDGLLDDKGRQYIHFAVDGANRMRQIIIDLLEFSRIGMAGENIEEIDLRDLLTEILLNHRKKMEETKAEISYKDLPTVKSYRVPLYQIFHNLISNALKYQEKGKVPVITIGCTEVGDHWQFSVQDNGIGINAEYFDKIFILFQRLHNKDEYSGTGIGLAICKKVISNLGGSIWLHSGEGAGSTFLFTFPKQPQI